MAKLTLLASLLFAMVALGALASATRTTITTTVVEEDNPRGGGQQQCREQIQRQQQMRHCQMYLSSSREYSLAMIKDGQNPQQQQHLRECCQQLRNIDEQCRCEAVREAVRQQQEEEEGEMEGGREEMRSREMMQRAENLPSRCNLSPRRCQIRGAALF